MNDPRVQHGMAALADGRVVVAGGWVYQQAVSTAEVFDPDAAIWSRIGPPPEALGLPTAVGLEDGRVLFAGQSPNALFDPGTSSFTPAGPIAVRRSFSAATLLNDGRVLFAGGSVISDDPAAPEVYAASAEVFDPVTGEFALTGSMKAGREYAQAVRLLDGRVLVVGGDRGLCGACEDQVKPLASAEIYDPATGAFTSTGAMHQARSRFTATLLADGRVLVAGGLGDGSAYSAEIYDPATGLFTATGSMATSRAWHAAVRLLDGRVLVVGGTTDTTAELYDPVSGRFTPTGPTTSGLGDVQAVRLHDGRVLACGDAPACELYWP